MNPVFRVLFLALTIACLLALAPPLPACAARDIVYAARYYSPPGSHRTSHYHLYRINPDGTGRTQLTYGNQDDSDPQWSPDGRWIAFERDEENGERQVCLMAAFGGPVNTLRSDCDGMFGWSPNSRILAASTPKRLLLIDRRTHRCRVLPAVADFVWSPDGRHAYLVVGDSFSKAGSHAEILTLQTGQRLPVPRFDSTTWGGRHSAVWADDKYLIGILHNGIPHAPTLGVCDLDGRLVRTITGHWAHGMSDPAAMSPDLGIAALHPGPVGQGWNVWAEDNSISSWYDVLYSRVETKTGLATPIAEGQHLIFSPSGHYLCLSPHQYLMRYARQRDGSQRHVWGTPLQMRKTNGGPIHTITPGLVYVAGADWRKRHL